jgi:transposase-like protein
MMAGDGDFLRPMVRAVIQEFLEAEMTEAIGAHKGERVEGRSGYRSGYYPRSLITRVGKLDLRVPQGRHRRFSTEIFERYQRSEKALAAALTEMYIQGIGRADQTLSFEHVVDAFSLGIDGAKFQPIAAARGVFSRARLKVASCFI